MNVLFQARMTIVMLLSAMLEMRNRYSLSCVIKIHYLQNILRSKILEFSSYFRQISDNNFGHYAET